MNYFDLFELPRRLTVDLKDLEQRFYKMSRRWHPDRFARASAGERQKAEESTALLNDGYRTLRDPVARAEYLLKQNGLDIGEQKSSNVPPELLEEVFELNMALEELRQGDEGARPQLEEALEKFVAMRAAIDADLQSQFARYDAAGGKESLEQIRAILNRRRYIRNLVNEVEKGIGRE